MSLPKDIHRWPAQKVLDYWTKSPDHRQALGEMLDSDAWVLARLLVSKLGEPHGLRQLDAGAGLAAHQKCAGWFECLRVIEGLPDAEGVADVVREPEEWGTLK